MESIERQLIDDAINEIISVYNLSPSFGELLKKNILKRAILYKGLDIPETNETKVIRRIDSLPLFFLNRLINNIRNYNIDENLDLSGNKGNYISTYQKLDLRSKESIKRLIVRALRRRVGDVSEDLINKAINKVVDHEIGHALQTSFSGALGVDDSKFKVLVDNLNRKYPNHICSYSELGSDPLTKEKAGMKVLKKDDEFSAARNYYAPNAYLTHIDEIFNEDESLFVEDINTPQMNYRFGIVFEKKIYNYDSSNYRITSYAKMMKLLLGKKDTFRAMYEDSIILYASLDEFVEEADEVFGVREGVKLTPMMEVFGRLDTVKGSRLDKNVIPQAYELDLFFTKCLLNIVNKVLALPDTKDVNLDLLLDTVKEFKECLLTSKHQDLETHRICEDMLNRINIKKYGKTRDDTDEYNNELYDEYVELTDRACEIIDLEDDRSYKSILVKLSDVEERMRKVSIDSFKKDLSSMSYDEKVQFFLFNMKKSIINKVPEAYRYYRSNLMQIRTGTLVDEKITPKF